MSAVKHSVVNPTAGMHRIEAGLQGLPDFGRPLQTRFGTIYGAFQSKAYRVPPFQIALQRNEMGSASIRLSLVRGELPFMPPEPYGVLGLKIQANYACREILTEFRAEIPGLVLQEIRSESGFVRLISMPDITPIDLVLPADAGRVETVWWDGGNALRMNLRIRIESAQMLEKMVLQDTLAARIFAEFELKGISPRHACTVDFDAVVLLDEVRSRLSSQGRINLKVLRDLFISRSAHFTFQDKNGRAVQFQGVELGSVIDAVIDRFIRRFARFVARDDTVGPEQIALSGSDSALMPVALIHWDLSRPKQISRILTLQSPGINQLGVIPEQRQDMIERIVLPVMRAGTRSIQVFANLAGRPAGLFLMGAHLSVPPDLPGRPQQILRSLEFDEIAFKGSALLPLAVSERLHYHYQGFISIQSDAGIITFLGAVSEQTDEKILVLSADAFGARFISFSISTSVAVLAVVNGLMEFTHSGQSHKIAFQLDQEHTSITLVVPIDGPGPLLGLSAEPYGKGLAINFDLHAVDGLYFDLPFFSEYGPHSIELHCQLHPAILYCEVEYLEEDKTDHSSAAEALVFFPDGPAQTCRWFAKSPFTPGLCYRVSVNGGSANGWSAPLRGISNLTLDIKLTESESNKNDAFSVTPSGRTTLDSTNQ